MKRLVGALCRFLMVVALGAFVFSAYQIISYLVMSSADNTYFDTLTNEAVTVQTTASAQPALQTPTTPTCPITVDFEAIWKENRDVVAWLYCADTPINYPIAQSEDNETYLHLRLNGEYSAAGTLFLDCNNSADFSDLNSVVYGHHMINDSMFGTLPNYDDPNYYKAHPIMWLITPQCTYRMDVFSGFVTPSDSESYTRFYDEDAFHAYIENAAARSPFQAGTDLKTAQRIITLSTCSYEYENARYVLLCKLTESNG